MRLLGNRLLVSPLPVQERTATGLFLPQGEVGDKKLWWKIEQVGEGAALPRKPKTKACGLHASAYAVGQTVITALHCSHHTMEDNSGRKIIGCDQVIGRLEEANA